MVALIARHMEAEVGSLYVLRPGEILELAATEGLAPDAVHHTRLRVGEGLVGIIAARARSLALADAQAHPDFAYRPETGEEAYSSLMGVPVLRGGRVLGVLVVQNVQPRDYTEEEAEALETVAMVLAEALAGSALSGGPGAADGDLMPARLGAIALTEGLGMGRAVAHRRGVAIARVVAENLDDELERLAVAMERMHKALDATLERSDLAGRGEHWEVLETYRLIARDQGWSRRIEDAIRGGLTAEAAVQKVLSDTRARMEQVTDPYLRERLSDLEDLGSRLLRHLPGLEGGGAASELPEAAVVMARNMGPAELLDYDLDRVKALVLSEGSPNAHVAIVARALELPVVGRCAEALTRIWPGDLVIVDADNGQVFARPGQGVRDSFAEALEARGRRRLDLAATRDLPAVSLDGTRIELDANAGLLIDLPHARENGAAGIGLYRTEVPFMVRDRFPDIDVQTRFYRRVLEDMDGKPVTFRTLDVGGDKVLPYWDSGAEENPAMGWRAIRVSLDRPLLLREQLRALVRAAAGRPLRVMFPMISEVSELDRARALLDREVESARGQSQAMPSSIEVGVMLEVPSLLWQLPAVFSRVDFVSVGSNDLLQFLFASDRGNARLAGRYDLFSPAALALFKWLVEQADAAGTPISLCGELAGRPLEAMALIGCGFRRLSMPPPAIARVRSMVRSLRLAPLAGYVDRLASGSGSSARETLRHYARDHGVVLD